MAQQSPPAKGEEPLRNKTYSQFNGVVNNSARNALPEGAWWHLENMQPIGNANIQTVNNISAALFNYTTHTIYWSSYAFVGADFLISFATDGTVHAWNIVAQTNTQIATGFSGSGSRSVQWKNNLLLLIDSTGYYIWPGSGTVTLISGTGVPTSGTDIAVAFGRVWISQGRLVTFSGADDFSAPAFLVANGAGTVSLTDPTLRNTVVRLIGFNGYLYIIGTTSINAVSDLYVPSGAVPPTPLFTNTNLQAIIGSDQPASFFPLNRGLMFANRYGAYGLFGTQAQKISTDIDGTWKFIDFSQSISGGTVVSNNIICAAYLVKRLNDPNFGSNTVLAMYHDQKWWFANYGALTLVASGIVNNSPSIFGFRGNVLFQLFQDNTTGPPTTLSTPLWPMEDNLADKQVIRAGFEVTVSTFNGSFAMTIDSTNNIFEVVQLNVNGGVDWQNNALQIVQWQNNALQIVEWFSPSYILYNSSTPGVYQKYVGQTITATGSIYQFSATDMDYKLGARWI